jgi:hypothetical protein
MVAGGEGTGHGDRLQHEPETGSGFARATGGRLGPTRLRKRTSDSLDGFAGGLGSEGSTLPAPLIDHGHVDVGWRSREPALERQGLEEP